MRRARGISALSVALAGCIQGSVWIEPPPATKPEPPMPKPYPAQPAQASPWQADARGARIG